MTLLNPDDGHSGAVSKYLELKEDTDKLIDALNITKAQMMKKSMDDIAIWATEDCDPLVVQKIVPEIK